MESKVLSKIANSPLLTIKVLKVIAGSTSAAKPFYFKPSFPCRLVNATLMVKTASAATAPTLAITKSIVTQLDCPKDVIVEGITEDSAVSNSAVMNIATGTTNNAVVGATPGANYQTAASIDITADEALKLNVGQCTTNALDATLILEIQPL